MFSKFKESDTKPTLGEFLVIVDAVSRENRHWRYGQTMSNCMDHLDGEFNKHVIIDDVRRYTLDPFYEDGNVNDYLFEALRMGVLAEVMK